MYNKGPFSISTVEDMLDDPLGAQVFSKLELRAGYHQICMHEDDFLKATFHTHNGHYEYFIMPFGLCNAPSQFQTTMNDIFWPILCKSVLVFFDDILVYSSSWEEHSHQL
ncbi:unnamed protein product [Linum trigynum]|uniref:Reverse transcriptase domain-containing protein n=1 Tax=Linum trigynum TaxID=586398 RepID=A0AAV2E9M2_9ROSI